MPLKERPDAKLVAEKARETFNQIREIRKSSPNKYAFQKKIIDENVKRLQDQWWDEVKHLMKDPIDTGISNT